MIKIGMTLGHSGDSVVDTVRVASEADLLGLDMLGFGDVPSLQRDTYIALGAAAQATKTVRIGPTVSNFVLRHPVVLASAIATIDELSGGRAFLGIGTGNSSVYNVRLEPGSIASVSKGLDSVHKLFGESRARGMGSVGRTVGLKWATTVPPVYVSAAGPRGVALAASEADGMIWDGGASEGVVTEWVERAHIARRECGRADEPFEVWVYAKGYVSDSSDEVRQALGAIVAAAANDAFRFTTAGKGVPKSQEKALRLFQERYSFAHHAEARSSVNIDLMRELGLEEFLFDRFAIAGSAEAVSATVRRLEAAGATAVLFSGAVPHKATLVRGLSTVRGMVKEE